MNIKKTLAAASIGLALAATAFAAAHSPISARQAAMKAVGGQMRTLGGMAQGKVAYDDFAALSALEIMRDAAATARPLFPAGTEMGEETRAKPEIWADGSDFDARMGQLLASLDAAIAAEPADLASYRPLFGAIAGGCKGCHEKYRAPEN
jgi:cytochrome c556